MGHERQTGAEAALAIDEPIWVETRANQVVSIRGEAACVPEAKRVAADLFANNPVPW